MAHSLLQILRVASDHELVRKHIEVTSFFRRKKGCRSIEATPRWCQHELTVSPTLAP